MAAPHNNNSERKILNTQDPNSIRILHRAKISEKWKRMLCFMGIVAPCTCLCCKKDEAWQSTYVQVHENRIEYNYPGVNVARCCRLVDNVAVYYFDKPLTKNAHKAGPCSPLCTHNTFFPDCCGICGETTVVHSDNLICRRFVMLPGLEDAHEVAEAIKNARSAPKGMEMSHH